MAKVNTMAETTNTPEQLAALAALAVKAQKIPQKLKVTDLTTGADDAEITNNYQKYTAPEYNAKIHGDKATFLSTLFKLASDLVQPVESQIDALLYRATQNSYQAGKELAYASGAPGQYLSPELKSSIVMVVKNSSTVYADKTAGEAFNAWKSAFTSATSFDGKTFEADQIAKRKAGADKVLATAQALSDSGADAF